MNSRYDWWGYVKGMIRRYPRRMETYCEMQSYLNSPQFDGMPHGGTPGNPVENAAVRWLSSPEVAEVEAVQDALLETEKLPYSQDVIRMIKMMYWNRSHTLYGASQELNISYRTARRYHTQFLQTVAKNRGIL